MPENNTNLPQVIILYGPPAAGKGTQAHFLKQKLPDYYHLDFGTELRKYVSDILGNYNSAENQINPKASQESIERAKRMKHDLPLGPVKTADLRFVVEKSFTDNISAGKGMIVEGPGRLVEEAIWLSDFFNKNSVSVCIFHLHLDLEIALLRTTTRYYLPSTSKPFKSYNEALKEALEGEKPYQRKDDTDAQSFKKRYKTLYSENFAKIISIYQLHAGCTVLTLDGNQPIEKVSKDIESYFQKFFMYNLNENN